MWSCRNCFAIVLCTQTHSQLPLMNSHLRPKDRPAPYPVDLANIPPHILHQLLFQYNSTLTQQMPQPAPPQPAHDPIAFLIKNQQKQDAKMAKITRSLEALKKGKGRASGDGEDSEEDSSDRSESEGGWSRSKKRKRKEKKSKYILNKQLDTSSEIQKGAQAELLASCHPDHP